MDPARRAVLLRQLGLTWSLAELLLDGLSDEECLWEPVPGCWTVRPNTEGVWIADWEEPEPDPAPACTIGWITWHIGWWWSMVYDHSFGAGTVQRENTPWPGTARGAVEWITNCHDAWSSAVDGCTEADLDSTERTRWPYAEPRPFAYVVAWANAELMKNVAEIGVLRRIHS
jgi:hypothetical protein